MSDNDFHKLRISQGKHRGKVKNIEITWRSFCRKFVEPSVDTSVTFAQYLKLHVDEQGVKKSAPGYVVGAHFEDGKRRLANMKKRALISLDLDTVTPAQMQEVEEGLSSICDYEFLRHTSRKHCPEAPRWRFHIPISRTVSHDEANAVTRILASRLFDDPQESVDAVDVVSHRFAQVSYMPSRSKDQEYRCEVNHGELLDVDQFLDSFEGDWRDHTQLPMRSDENNARAADPNRKMELPTDKPGILGAWCRTYTVDDVIAEFLSDVYEPGVSTDGHTRYTYLLGTGSNGAVSYDEGLFLFSNHGSDPIEGAANAWDLARIHLFGELDKDAREGTTPGSMPSYKAMVKFAQEDEDVREALMSRRADLFDDDDEDDDAEEEERRDPVAEARQRVSDSQKTRAAALEEPEEKDLDDFLGGRDDSDDLDDFLGGSDKDDLDDFLGGSDDSNGGENEGEEEIADRFDDDEDDDPDEDDEDDDPDDTPSEGKKKKKKWRSQLKANLETGQIAKSVHNINLIFGNDPAFENSISYNDFSHKIVTRKLISFPRLTLSNVPIPDAANGREWLDADDYDRKLALAAPINLGGYDIDVAQLDITAAVETAARNNCFHPILDRLDHKDWDGVERAERMFIDYLGVEDHVFSREAARAFLLAAVARVHEPGHKFDNVPILGGAQGLGKSSFIRILSMGYFGELSAAFDQPTRLVESMMGCWIMEVPELAGFRKAEIETVKQFFSAQEDRVRLAYRRNEETFKRQCVFMGSTNKDEYLKDETGNRRFWPLKCHKALDQEKLQRNVSMIWAEAMTWYRAKREEQPHGQFYIGLETPAAHVRALELQEESRTAMPADFIAEALAIWLEKPVTEDQANSESGVQFDDDEDDGETKGRRLRVTLLEAWHGGVGVLREPSPLDLQNLSAAVRMVPGWAIERKMIAGSRQRFVVREGSNWEKKAWETL